MRILRNALLAFAGLCVTIVAAALCWLYLYSGDIPNLGGIAAFAPSDVSIVAYDCAAARITVVPYDRVGQNVVAATRAAEGDDRIVSLQIARRLFCNYKNQTQTLQRHLLEYKLSARLRRRFTSSQILTIYLNGAYFGEGVFGIENAAHHYYGKGSSDLDLAQAAMIAGMMRSPNMYSRERHPEKATQRRDQVLDAMVAQGAISAAQADVAKSVSAKCEAVSR